MKIISQIMLLAILMLACGPSDKELAQVILKEAQVAMEVQDYNGAKLKVDSLNLLYSDQIEEVAEGQRLMMRIEIDEQEKSLEYFDTLLIKRKEDLEKLKGNFIFQKGKFEGYVGTYIHKRQQVKNSHARSYVKAYLDEKGEFYISSRYHGKSHIHHNSIKVYDDGLFAETEAIDASSFDNRRFDDGEDFWETVNYRSGADNGVVSFIVNNFDEKLKVEFKGKRHHYIVMESFDKEAVRDAYNLSLVIKEVKELEGYIGETEKNLSSLRAALGEGDNVELAPVDSLEQE